MQLYWHALNCMINLRTACFSRSRSCQRQSVENCPREKDQLLLFCWELRLSRLLYHSSHPCEVIYPQLVYWFLRERMWLALIQDLSREKHNYFTKSSASINFLWQTLKKIQQNEDITNKKNYQNILPSSIFKKEICLNQMPF